MNITNPTDARKDFYQLLKNVNSNHEPIYISGKNTENNAVIIGLKDWKSIQETMYLESTGTMDKVRERERDTSGKTNIEDIDWHSL
ncbi:type II toxin-antitoxin system Phd/YefM family antitoxin [Staphylococcus agnetis]|uniref:type II toxin-antitoxin system Phd/YefM family antitoxin n=1 Tax=Staphylococcus agnetis TaxID=985762 RepID=UPI00071F6036|nr:type II toxin-antitoxin system Phd/YefM family antitoxin [Staphylococcus agnetis]ALN78143.1 type II toxin-antitoxin system Phd/YefM family antitoxin [Staphylococcus agnetis]NJI14401.1 type II toxin-antitoxin system prevent-host-death family antitoxin [Staphylococcus agnetis]HEE8876717.1 type II toxin-antitoxin system Phd/YefM family antitoxin [Staphylococcus aureus]